MHWPQFEDPFLADLMLSLRKRHKSLKHQARAIRCERVVEQEDRRRTEKMELALHPWATRGKISVRMHAWAGRWVWVDARAAAKQGWAWEWSHEGRLLGAYGGRDIVAGIEDTLRLAHNMESQKTKELADIWASLLAQGPKPLEPD